ncbi:MAG: hypothetical protein R3C49_18305 [Planctomycetaceae bacterium]
MYSPAFMTHHDPIAYPWLHGRVPNGFWDYRENRLLYMNWLAAECGYVNPDDWYYATKDTFSRHCGSGMLHGRFNDSVLAALQDYLPHYNWEPWRFSNTPLRYWHSIENRRKYMTWLGEQLGFQKPEDWYQISKDAFLKNCGRGLLRSYYGDSPQAAVREYLPDIDWKPWLFRSVPQQFWQNPQHRLSYLKWLGNQLGYRTSQEWDRLTCRDLRENHGAGLLAFYSDHPEPQLEEIPAQLTKESIAATPTEQRPVWRHIRSIECAAAKCDLTVLMQSLV